MRITTSEHYYHGYDCPLRDCDRRYCGEHRLLYRDCDTAVKWLEGDGDVIGGTRVVWEVDGDCPECKADWRKKQHYRELQRRYPKDGICPVCFKMSRAPDDIAVHLMEEHEWEYEPARLWLAGEVERIGAL